MKKTIILFAIAAIPILHSCTKESLAAPNVAANPQHPLYVQQMESSFMSCSDTATHANSNVAGYSVETGQYKTYDFTAVTDAGAKMHYKVKDINGGLVATGDTLRMLSVVYTPSCGTDSVVLRTNHTMPTFTITSGPAATSVVNLYYHDCAMPLNGLSGEVRIIWNQ
jgi:hypothetical protein